MCGRRTWVPPVWRPFSSLGDQVLNPRESGVIFPSDRIGSRALNSSRTTEHEPWEGAPPATDDVFREINERIVELGERFGFREEPLLELVCECDDRCCTQRVSIPPDAYEDVRAHSGRHLVHEGHERAGRVIADGDGYVVVED
jgi:hypothetical protein